MSIPSGLLRHQPTATAAAHLLPSNLDTLCSPIAPVCQTTLPLNLQTIGARHRLQHGWQEHLHAGRRSELAALLRTGSPVCASRARNTLFNLATSIRVRDTSKMACRTLWLNSSDSSRSLISRTNHNQAPHKPKSSSCSTRSFKAQTVANAKSPLSPCSRKTTRLRRHRIHLNARP